MCVTVRTIKAGICNVCQFVCLSASLSVVKCSQDRFYSQAGGSEREAEPRHNGGLSSVPTSAG